MSGSILSVRNFVIFGAVTLTAANNLSAAPAKNAGPTDEWRQGRVNWHDEWLTPEDVAKDPRGRDVLAGYEAKRAATPVTIDGQLQLAQWCGQKRLAEQERAHLNAVLQIDPTHKEARDRLGFKLVNGDWLSREEIAKSKASAREAEQSLKQWRPKVKVIANLFRKANEKQQTVAKAKLLAITDSRAIPAMEAEFANSDDAARLAFIETLNKMKSPDASLALARQALGPNRSVREAAVKQLQLRPLESFVPQLLATMSSPLQSKVDLYQSPDGRVTFRHSFLREGQQTRWLSVVDQSFRSRDGGAVSNAPELARHEAAIAVTAAQQASAIEDNNEAVSQLLNKISELDLPAKAEVWWSWWNDLTETYQASEKPLDRRYAVNEVALSDVSRYYGASGAYQAPTAGGETVPRLPAYECLIAGTPVWTSSGMKAVEQIQIGDLVLSQNIETGELTYKPVLQTTTRPAEPLITFTAGKDDVTCSGGHLFWAEGKAWTRARQLEPGVALHAVGEQVDVQQAGTAKAAKTYNLIVADFHTYFVGKSKLLSHDNTPQRATAMVTPGTPE